ncbi:MAG: gephyrin-like molybdotransferase Glp [Desulfopila sp.]
MSQAYSNTPDNTGNTLHKKTPQAGDGAKVTPPRDMLGRMPLISVTEATDLLLERLGEYNMETEHVALEDALDRITAEPVLSPEDLPPHPRSTMDGFAVHSGDTFGASESMPCYLHIAGEVHMGEQSNTEVTRGCCCRIATGGLLPPGADAVVMHEHTVPVDDTMIEIVKSVGQGGNVIQTGDDIRRHAPALEAGHKLRPQDLGLLAGLGITEVAVRRSARMALLSTGDEIVPCSQTPLPGKIRNINSIVLGSAARRMGVKVNDYGIVEDTEECFFPAIAKAVAENDLVVFSGGSSVGTRDLGERAISRLGEPGVMVHGVTLKPGKPIIIGFHKKTPLFGLPGHPVSAMTCFDLFVRPALSAIAGIQQQPLQPTVSAYLARNIPSAAGRRDIVRVRLISNDHTFGGETFTAEPVLGKSGSISTLSRAHGYIVVHESLQGIPQNTEVEVHLYT